MIVVIVITSLMMGLLLAGMQHIRRNMRTTRGLANLKEMTQTIHTYAAENRAELPIGFHTPDGNNPPELVKPSDPDTEWSILLNNYMTGTGSTNAEVVMSVDIGGTMVNVPQILPLFRDPNATFPDQGYLHYSVHPVLMPDTAHIYDININWRRYKLAWLQRPHEVVLIMDAAQRPNAIVPYSAFATSVRLDNVLLDPSNQSPAPFPSHIFYDPSAADNDNLVDSGSNDDTVANAGNIRWRQHGNKAANFAFPDGHSETISIDKLKKRNIRADLYN